MAKALTKTLAALLATIVAAGENGTYGKPADLQKLVDAGFVETNPGATNPANAEEIAVRATPAGVAESGQPAAPATVSSFTLDDGVALPTTTTRSKPSVYPFDAMGVGQSFFVPNTEDKPNAAKSMASTISSANKRFKNEADESLSRVYVVRAVDETDAGRGKGARVWRKQ